MMEMGFPGSDAFVNKGGVAAAAIRSAAAYVLKTGPSKVPRGFQGSESALALAPRPMARPEITHGLFFVGMPPAGMAATWTAICR
jgi:hypothetical protein